MAPLNGFGKLVCACTIFIIVTTSAFAQDTTSSKIRFRYGNYKTLDKNLNGATTMFIGFSTDVWNLKNTNVRINLDYIVWANAKALVYGADYFLRFKRSKFYAGTGMEGIYIEGDDSVWRSVFGGNLFVGLNVSRHWNGELKYVFTAKRNNVIGKGCNATLTGIMYSLGYKF